MTNLAENQKDQQIARQKETIDSLERKVQSLESELQKCLDPDSGEINPAIRYHYRTGEDALRQQIEILQKQIEPGEPLVACDLLEARLWATVNALFLPVKAYNRKSKEFQWESQEWWYFRDTLFELDIFSHQWSRPEFRLGVDMLNDICQATDTAGDGPKALTRKHLDIFDFAGRIFGGSSEWAEKKIIAVNELISALWKIIENFDNIAKAYIYKDSLYDMMATLKLVLVCQRMWMEAEPVKQEPDAEE